MVRPCIERGCPELTEGTRCDEHLREWNRKRKAQGATGARGTTRQWGKLRELILRRDGWQCRRCSGIGSMLGLEVHHLDGRAANNSPANLITLCRDCHVEVHRGKAA
jgi:5-methylcytosine-specific restriction endonuclease McrA